ncbi:hypothetical protein BDQ17DRAFT_1239476 [Cyathus striatus]|nr:hypothetical protein BDQ17DRAFT_1239476 [Cyathus striatus]
MLINSEKQTYATKIHVAPLSARPMDLVYFSFFAMHLPATLFLDLQGFYPTWLVPGVLKSFMDWYVHFSADPLIGQFGGYFGDSNSLLWFKSFAVLEMLFQLPTFILGMRGLYKGSRTIYVLLLAYGASTATTTLPCIVQLLTTPETTSATIAKGIVSVTNEQRFILLSSYVPFFLIPLIMAVDMSLRITRLVKAGLEAENENKWK